MDTSSIESENDLVAGFQTELVPHRLGDHDLALGSHLVSHTHSITYVRPASHL